MKLEGNGKLPHSFLTPILEAICESCINTLSLARFVIVTGVTDEHNKGTFILLCNLISFKLFLLLLGYMCMQNVMGFNAVCFTYIFHGIPNVDSTRYVRHHSIIAHTYVPSQSVSD